MTFTTQRVAVLALKSLCGVLGLASLQSADVELKLLALQNVTIGTAGLTGSG